MERYSVKMRGNRQSQQQRPPSPCTTNNSNFGNANGSSVGAAAVKRGPDPQTLISQLNQLDELAALTTNNSIRNSGSTTDSSYGPSPSHIVGSNSLDEMDQIVQAVSSKLSVSQSIGSTLSSELRPTRSLGSSTSYASNVRDVTSVTASTTTSNKSQGTSSNNKTRVGHMLSNSSDDVEISATKWYTHRRTNSIDSMEDTSSEGSIEQSFSEESEFFDVSQSFLKEDYEDSEPLPVLTRSSNEKPQEFDDVWEDGELYTTEIEPKENDMVGSGTEESSVETEEREDDEETEENDANYESSEDGVEEYESDASSKDESIPPPPLLKDGVTSSSIIPNKPQQESPPSLQHTNVPEKNGNGSDSAEDYSDDEDEGEEGYKIGGYHPVKISEVYNERFVYIV